MKRVWIAGSILILLCALALWNGLSLGRFADNLASSLEQAQGMAEKGNWDEAARITQNAERRFRDRAPFLHVILRHCDIDDVETAFREVEQLLSHRERLGEYAAANARLVARLEIIGDGEHFALQNIL